MNRLLANIFLVLLLISGCAPATNLPPNQPPIAVIDSIFPSEIGVGEQISFVGYSNDIDGKVVTYSWRSSLDGELNAESAFKTKALSEGKHVIYFKVQDNDGVWSDDVQQTVIVIKRPPVPPPVIDFFLASPRRIGTGDSSTLSWHITGATNAYIDQDVGNVPVSGSIKVSPILNRQYTLTASNESSSSTAAIFIIVVPAKVGLPAVNSFAVEPGNITSGQSAILKWNVSNSEFVEIDPGITVHDPIGTAYISPAKNTTYTITAYNVVGIVVATTQVTVTAMPTTGLPDLVLINIGKIETGDGVKIGYSVENRGTNNAPPSTTRIYANGVYRASDSLGALPAGASVTRTINGWLYDPATNIIEVRLDADNNLIEKDKANNMKQQSLPVRTSYDFIDNASRATWGVGYPYKQIRYGDLNSEQGGTMVDETDNKTEDAAVHAKILVTWPNAVYSGWIMGDYDGIEITPGDHFYGKVGLMEGAFGGDVSFWVFIRSSGDLEWELLVPGVQHTFNYRIQLFSAPVPTKYWGKKVEFSLRVSAEREPFQDWAAWVDARIIR